MNRPFVVSVVAFLLMLTGAAGLVSDGLDLRSAPSRHDEIIGIAAVHLLAVIAGVFMLRAQNWARWLAIAWITFHVVLSLWHPPMQLLVHTILFAVFLWCLFRGKSGAYFANRETIP